MDDPLSYFMGAFTVGRSNHKIPHYDGLSSILARELRGQGKKKKEKDFYEFKLFKRTDFGNCSIYEIFLSTL